jgi:hypothetical protein
MERNLRWFIDRHPSDLHVRRIDVSADPQAGVDNDVLWLPTLVLQDGDQEVARLAGYSSKKKLVRKLEQPLDADSRSSVRFKAGPWHRQTPGELIPRSGP